MEAVQLKKLLYKFFFFFSFFTAFALDPRKSQAPCVIQNIQKKKKLTEVIITHLNL